MNVAQLLDALGFAPNIKIIVAGLPEGTAFGFAQLAGNILLEHLQRERELRSFRFGHQKVHVLGHDYISSYVESIPLPRSFQSLLEDVTSSGRTQTRGALVAAKREKVQTAHFLKSFEAPGHMELIVCRSERVLRDCRTKVLQPFLK